MRFITLLYSVLITLSLTAQTEGTPDVIRGSEQFTLLIKTVDLNTDEPLDGTLVSLYSTKTDGLLDSKTTNNGLVSFQIDPFSEYEIRTCNPDYFKNGMSIYECNEGNEILCTFGATDYTFAAGGGSGKPDAILKATLALSPMNIGSIYELQNVYYDLDKANLRPTAKKELDELVSIMERNKSITIELSSHTDSRADKKYNKDLSQQRAQSCYDYLISKGIASDRITPIGYGENKLVNQCKDGVNCTEKQHQKNRRTEIQIIKYAPIACVPTMDVDFAIKDLKGDDDDS